MNETVAYIRGALGALYPAGEVNTLIRRIIEYVCRMPLAQQLLCKDTQLSQTEKERIHIIVRRLEKMEPLQYVFGETVFCGLTLEVNPSVLIPRPETEELVELIRQTETDRCLKIMDTGTGSGCIAIALAHYLPEAEVYAVDISESALATARSNAVRNGVSINFIHADILRTTLPELPPLDVIVANPPYVRESEKKDMQANVLDYEPPIALFVPDDDPLLFYRRIAAVGRERLKPDGRLFLEVNEAFGAATVSLLHETGYRNIELIRDLSNKERIIKAVI